MNFKDLNFDYCYISHGEENIINSLLLPAFKHSILYQRCSAYFSSSVFRLLIKSLNEFIKNKGKIQLIISPELSSGDLYTIKHAYELREGIIKDKFEKDFFKSLQEFEVEELEVLHDLIQSGIMDIKVACTKSGYGIYHDKLGILYDKDGNIITFNGSANSSYNAYVNNYERIHVLFSWVDSLDKLVQNEVDEFNKNWNNLNEFLDIYDIKEIINTNIIKVKKNKIENPKKTVIELRDYQKEAIDNWINNGYKGFYVMATGTGKTWTAIYSAKKLLEYDDAIVTILAPYKHLINQWEIDIQKVFTNFSIVKIFSENTKWRDEAKQAILNKKFRNKGVILLSTIKSFNSDDFQNILDSSNDKKLLIVDEAHRFTNRDDCIKNKFNYFLGLSATPSNGKNIESKRELLNFFGGQVFSLPIEEALKRNYLVSYEYHPILLDTTEEDERKFKKCSQIISQCFGPNNKVIDEKTLRDQLAKRLRILSMSENKISHMNDILSITKNKKNFIVYCGDGKLEDDKKYINFVKQHLDNNGVISSQFTAMEDAKTRMQLIDSFNENIIDCLVAIKCLDEGVDIPSIKEAIILSSNDSYREFVQRRGRILRKHNDKDIAHIYDVILMPSLNTPGIAQIELRRYYEFAKLSSNYSLLKDELDTLLAKYNLSYDKIEFKDENELEDELDE